jgi:hypothetical protein
MPPKCGVGLRVSNRSRGALDKAGVNAEILPTAVVIDKRIADGEQGYSASIEREAGLGAVTTSIPLDLIFARSDATRAQCALLTVDSDLAPASI